MKVYCHTFGINLDIKMLDSNKKRTSSAQKATLSATYGTMFSLPGCRQTCIVWHITYWQGKLREIANQTQIWFDSGLSLREKCPNTEQFLVRIFPHSEVSLRIQSECRNIRTRNYSVFGHFSRSLLDERTFMLWLR